ncbi:helix-turn-helix domain-containing protein [Nocardiopsis sp. MG754419]|uniref:helix-turn-helix domain-containing protein n=1 Tax=Nocardiopsis sp. MG754419 TaxID=2259865 RepID=UPI001BA7E286|nr:XRE family transcriptional regulator [Nocardiopsis sp. MG754419]MBR8742108.1 XRE family transcriptional regulator [Nocardiopsis sp. MG754419]
MNGDGNHEPEADAAVLQAVGARLRRLRAEARLTLVELSARTGITPSTLSRLETGRIQPTLGQLLPLSRAYRVPIGDLVDAPRVGDPRVHLHPVRRFGLTFIPLTRRAGGVQAYKVLYPPARDLPAPELRTHEGHEWFYVLSGTVRLVLGTEQDLVLNAGEAAEFDTRTPHWIGNPAERSPAEVIAIFGTQGERIHLHES